MPETFKEQLVNFAGTAVTRSERALTEEATKQYLVLPFFQLLGYDPLDPDEIIPEAHASFSDKFKNKVDYAVCIESQPVIAVECKRVGQLTEANRGELKGYFNAVPSAKLGILTDGLIYELYSDTHLENMMDDQPFVVADLSKFSKDRISDQVLDALLKLRKGTFDPADVGADARQKIYTSQYIEALEENFNQPSEIFVKAVMDVARVEGRRTSKLVEEHAPMVASALSMFLDRKILERVGFASRQDLVKMQHPVTPQLEQHSEPPAEIKDTGESIITTDTEMAIFNHVRARLAYLVDTEEMFEKVQKLQYRDYKTIFLVFYKFERKGKLFHFTEGPSGEFRFYFPEVDGVMEVSKLSEIDDVLLTSFKNRISDLDGN